MTDKILECVPNFSQGRNLGVIRQITDAIGSVEGVRVLNVDSGYAANRTVVTFVGTPEAVVEAAFRGVEAAARLIDMSQHTGEHPRIGATDVLPLIPISGITLDQAATMARELAQRIACELHIPTYVYESSAFTPERIDLAYCRKGEYEGLKDKIFTTEGRPDFGDCHLSPTVVKAGATVVGARDFLIAVNFNLNTPSAEIATQIAQRVRARGYAERDDSGAIVRDPQGVAIMVPGELPGTKAIGWYIEEYGVAQVSMNITNIAKAPLHTVYQTVCRVAESFGVRVTGTEIIGLVPLKVLTDAGSYFFGGDSENVEESKLIDIAITTMGLSDLHRFVPQEKVVEYLMQPEEIR